MPSIADVLEAGQGMVPRSAKCSPATLTRSCHWLSCWHPCTALPCHTHFTGEPGQAQGSGMEISKRSPGCCTHACP